MNNYPDQDATAGRAAITALEGRLRSATEEIERLSKRANPAKNLLIYRDGSMRWHFGEVEGYHLTVPRPLDSFSAVELASPPATFGAIKYWEFVREPMQSRLPYTIWLER